MKRQTKPPSAVLTSTREPWLHSWASSSRSAAASACVRAKSDTVRNAGPAVPRGVRARVVDAAGVARGGLVGRPGHRGRGGPARRCRARTRPVGRAARLAGAAGRPRSRREPGGRRGRPPATSHPFGSLRTPSTGCEDTGRVRGGAAGAWGHRAARIASASSRNAPCPPAARQWWTAAARAAGTASAGQAASPTARNSSTSCTSSPMNATSSSASDQRAHSSLASASLSAVPA